MFFNFCEYLKLLQEFPAQCWEEKSNPRKPRGREPQAAQSGHKPAGSITQCTSLRSCPYLTLVPESYHVGSLRERYTPYKSPSLVAIGSSAHTTYPPLLSICSVLGCPFNLMGHCSETFTQRQIPVGPEDQFQGSPSPVTTQLSSAMFSLNGGEAHLAGT